MAGPRDYHTKQSKAEKEGQTPYDITYVESKPEMCYFKILTEAMPVVSKHALWLVALKSPGSF